MHLKSLSLINYKNIESADYELDNRINVFVGNNGVGKTNTLDAVYHLSFGKSYFNPVTSQNIQHGTDFFVIDGRYAIDEKDEKIVVSAKRGGKKIIKRNGKEYERLSEHIGALPLTIISPADRDLIIEGSETRRKLVDSIIAQSDKPYLQDLIKYNKLLQQRNALLKYFAANRHWDSDALAVYTDEMTPLATRIHETRRAFIETFEPIFQQHYQSISADAEAVELRYKSSLNELDAAAVFKQAEDKDKVLQYSSAGTHKDDLVFSIAGHPIKKFGSQGQQKSYLIALKLAQFDFIKQQSGRTPILLLDDIFDKLDEHRVAQIVRLVDADHFGQIFISDTHADRTEEIVKATSQSYKIFKL